MNKKGQGTGYGIPIIMIFLAIFFVLFIVLVYPSERAELLGDVNSTVVSVAITSDGFSPSHIEIKAGGRVTWINRETSKHTITFLDSESSILGPGGSYSKRFLETGSFTYTSDFNPGFKGTIKVT
jgi:plastocyanin